MLSPLICLVVIVLWADLSRHDVLIEDGNKSRMEVLLSWLNPRTCRPGLTDKILQSDTAVSKSLSVGSAITEIKNEHLVTETKIKGKNKKRASIGKIKIKQRGQVFFFGISNLLLQEDLPS